MARDEEGDVEGDAAFAIAGAPPVEKKMTAAIAGCCGLPLYAWVLTAILAGIVLGFAAPDIATNPGVALLGTGFVHLIQMVIGPVIFCTVVTGIAHVSDAAKVGRVAVKAIVYFEVISSFALVIGLVVANIAKPGDGFKNDTPDEDAVKKYVDAGKSHSIQAFILGIIPKTMVSSFAGGNILQVLFVSILFGFALMTLGERGQTMLNWVESLGEVMFKIVGIVMYAAPVGAFGAMAFTVGKYGISTLGSLLGLVLLFYLTAALFIFGVLGVVALLAGINIFRFLFYIRNELLLVVATSSSESALPALMEKLKALGCSDSVVGLVVPLGYSFNLDGTNIYMTLATLFIAQAMRVQLGFGEQMYIIGVAMLTSKGATGVTGAGFITLASTLSAVRPELVPGMAIVLGIDKFMSECRSITNIIGNGIACIVISWSEGGLDREALDRALGSGTARKGAKGRRLFAQEASDEEDEGQSQSSSGE